MPHAVRDEQVPGDNNHRDNQHHITATPSAPAVGTTQSQSPMLKAWEEEHNRSNLTINETLFLVELSK
ncbi:hypothetical protein QBC35DRAFT_452820 [Podospora australis]|uniref:Uncharacterized protein n=1 Tax=Podospora australis TaxID=1536484 RepID=A0AAN6WRX7_9PEZI|nr:hypothetical protein QBC35DRAFT_452820 [Podospora australis]